MTPERGPLPPHWMSPGLTNLIAARRKDAMDYAEAYAIQYAAAEVARFIDAPSVGNWIAADDYMRNVKALDVALNGEGGAERPLLIDVLGQVEAERRRLGRPVLEVARLAVDAEGNASSGRDRTGQAVAWQYRNEQGEWVIAQCRANIEGLRKQGYEVRALGVIATLLDAVSGGAYRPSWGAIEPDQP